MKPPPKDTPQRVSPLLVVLGVLALALGLASGLYMSLLGTPP